MLLFEILVKSERLVLVVVTSRFTGKIKWREERTQLYFVRVQAMVMPLFQKEHHYLQQLPFQLAHLEHATTL